MATKKINLPLSAAQAKKRKPKKSLGFMSSFVVPRVVGEKMPDVAFSPPPRIKYFAYQNRKTPTLAERRFRDFLFRHEKGVMRGRWREQHQIGGDWLIDFYFPEVRLAIEIDGLIHNTAEQRKRDLKKEAAIERHDITLVRFTNNEVLAGDQQIRLLMRRAWIRAKNRSFHTVGTVLSTA